VEEEEEDIEEEALIDVGDYRRQAQRSLMLNHLRESSARMPGLEQIDWAHLDNQGLHAAVSAIVRVHTALQSQSNGLMGTEAQQVQQQLAALYAAASKSGGTGLSEEQLLCVPCFECDEQQLESLLHKTCAICHEDLCVGDDLRKLQCEHAYHSSCVGHWLRIKAACPMCNASARPK